MRQHGEGAGGWLLHAGSGQTVGARAMVGKGRTISAGATAADYRYCAALQRRFGKSYYFATRFFPAALRPHVHALYAFVRVPDQWVDEPAGISREEAQRLIDCYEADLRRALEGEEVESPVLRAFAQTARQFHIPLRYMTDFLDAMRRDLHCLRYHTYAELEGYMWGSAGVVGAMMLCLFRSHHEQLLPYAVRMGEAMQMTNFLRDVGEDWRRGRVYLPQEDLERFGVTEGDIAQGRLSEPMLNLLRFEIERTRALYREAEVGIALLPREYRYPVLLGSRLYAQILYRIEANGYDVFRQRARTGTWEKVWLAWRCWRQQG
ncbi:MAG: phytoene/squalene synthase family protein [Armatimonadota bacterium]|nr:phytoene/squalene synthase family protein [Armatimonadota bacterium]